MELAKTRATLESFTALHYIFGTDEVGLRATKQ